MRTIKFRAWDNFNGRMLGPFGPFRHHDEYDLLYLDGSLDVPAEDNLNFMQFTGLFDKNGKEIYEGDIVKCLPSGIIGSVEWVNELAFFDLKVSMADRVGGSMTVYSKEIDGLSVRREIIGNIYSNPELLNP